MSGSVDVKVRVSQSGPTASVGIARNHEVTMDRPESKGGQNKGAMGGETLLMGLGGCFMSNLLAAAQARNTALFDVTLDICGTIEANPSRFTAVKMRVSTGHSDVALVEKLIRIAEKGCIVANTLKPALEVSIILDTS